MALRRSKLLLLVNLLRRAGVDVVMASASTKNVSGKYGIIITADTSLGENECNDFDVLFLPGGPAVGKLREDENLICLIQKFFIGGKLIAAICGAPSLLKEAGILCGKSYTAHSSCDVELPESSGRRVVYDFPFVTSRGAGTALDFGLELVTILCGRGKSEELAAAIMI